MNSFFFYLFFFCVKGAIYGDSFSYLKDFLPSDKPGFEEFIISLKEDFFFLDWLQRMRDLFFITDEEIRALLCFVKEDESLSYFQDIQFSLFVKELDQPVSSEDQQHLFDQRLYWGHDSYPLLIYFYFLCRRLETSNLFENQREKWKRNVIFLWIRVHTEDFF